MKSEWGLTKKELVLIPTVLLAVLVVWLGSLSAYRKIQSFQTTGIQVSRAGGTFEVVESFESTGLLVNDRILDIAGASPASAKDLQYRLLSETTTTLLVQRGAELLKVRYTRPPLLLDFSYLSLALAGLVYLVIGLYTITRAREPSTRLFFLWCLASSAVYLFTWTPKQPLDALAKATYILETLARIALPPLTLHLFLVFPAPLGRRALSRLTAFIYLPSAVLVLLQADLMLANGRYLLGSLDAIAMLDRIEVFLLGIFSLLALVLLASRLTVEKDLARKRQLQWIASGMALGYLPFIAFYIVPYTSGLKPPQVIETLSVLPLILVPLAIAFSILRYKLWDLGVLLRDGVSWALALVLGGSLFSLLQILLKGPWTQVAGISSEAVSGAAGLLVAGFLIPSQKSISGGLERLYYSSAYDKRKGLVDFGKSLLGQRDLHQLCKDLLHQLRASLELQPVQLFLNQDNLLRGFEDSQDISTIDPAEFSDEWWSSDIRPLSSVLLPSEKSAPEVGLFTAGFRYAFPLVVQGQRIGILSSGYRHGEVPLSSEDLDLILTLLHQASLAIDNARLFGRLEHRLDEVVRLKTHNDEILQSTPAGIVVLDQDFRILSSNQALHRILGRTPTALSDIRHFLPIEPLPASQEGPVDIAFCSLQGEEFYLQVSVADQLSAAGHRILVIHDVHDKVNLENELREKDRLASLGMLAAGVAHEVNTPLTGISSYAQMLLANTPENDRRHDLLEKIERQTFRASRIVNNLLQFARDQGDEIRATSLSAILQESVDHLATRIEGQNVAVNWNKTGGEDGFIVNGNDGELGQVFSNLLVNALDAMKGPGTLTLSLEQDSHRVQAHVDDTGPGISQPEMERIFQPFYSTKLTSGGTGLGLSISYQIVRRHGGHLKASSEPGKGSRFTVDLPRSIKN